MSKFIGRQVKVGLAKESPRNTPAAPVILVPFDSFDFDDNVVQPRSTSGLGVIDDASDSFVTTKFGEGTLGGELRDQSIGYWLNSLLGTVSTTGPVDSAYTHVFSVLQTVLHPTLAMRVYDTNATEMYGLVLPKSMTITAALDEIVKISIDLLARKGRTWEASVLNATAENRFTKKHIQVKVAANRAGLGAASTLCLKNLSLTFNQNAMLDDCMGTAEPEDIINGPLSIEGEMSLNYTDETWKNYMRDGSKKALQITLTNNDVLIGAATRPSLTFVFPKVDFFPWKSNYPLGELATQTVSFKALRDETNIENNIYSATLVNTKVSY